MSSNNHPWLVNISGSAMISMNNYQYLEHLLQVSRKIVSEKDNGNIRSLIWDLEEFKTEQVQFYNRYSMQIETEISSLKRILSYDLIKKP